ncbi:putative cytochrome P450 oxidoreductase [Aspergillus campestris IBT 28561]|uniref:Cytochrome P450 oxidoreductase n=1 Tax=Aspergillus campestris (strain IBT 28561) TaxID=1392248 RepID=A0A2I1DCU3_ASPC2|nr:putative cytochrome P450 oxidoreductase [Aspergillus campestris IBT 28561]PKY07675.1 putative cytochrome P450 oxidoreductase [Aspergillus campestris IBT 28561]
MTTRWFYLIAGSTSGDQCLSVDISNMKSLDDLRRGTASMFSVAVPESISFHGESGLLSSINEIEQTRSKIRVCVDNQAIREPAGPREIPFVGNYFEIHPDHLGNHERLFHRYGNVIKTVVMGRTVYLTNDPRVSEVVFGENEFFTKKTSDPNHPLFWISDVAALFAADTAAESVKLAHKFVPPSMSPKAVQHYMPAMRQEIQSSFKVFDALDDRHQPWNAYQYMLKLSSQVVSKMVLGLDVGHFHTPDTQLHELVSVLGEFVVAVRQASLSFPWLKYAALQSTCIADYLKRAVDDGNQKLPDEYIPSNALLVLAAGISATSSMLSYLLYFLANYPETQAKILQELINNDVTPEKCWTYDTIMSLPYLDGFVKEGLRLHGPAFQPARNAKTDVIVPGAYRIPAGAVVNPLFSSIHRNKEYWENPSLFHPERWLSANVKKHRMAYSPFAAGPRGCVGFNVAHIELRMILAMLVLRYEFIDMSPDPVVYDHEYLLELLVNCYVRAKRRTAWPEKAL